MNDVVNDDDDDGNDEGDDGSVDEDDDEYTYEQCNVMNNLTTPLYFLQYIPIYLYTFSVVHQLYTYRYNSTSIIFIHCHSSQRNPSIIT